jgi:hypothetical protein
MHGRPAQEGPPHTCRPHPDALLKALGDVGFCLRANRDGDSSRSARHAAPIGGPRHECYLWGTTRRRARSECGPVHALCSARLSEVAVRCGCCAVCASSRRLRPDDSRATRLRKRVLPRDPICRCCAARASQIAHHVQPIEAGGAYDESGVLDAWPRTMTRLIATARYRRGGAPLSLSAASQRSAADATVRSPSDGEAAAKKRPAPRMRPWLMTSLRFVSLRMRAATARARNRVRGEYPSRTESHAWDEPER